MAERIDKTMSLKAANVWAFVLAIPVFVVFLGSYMIVWGVPEAGLRWIEHVGFWEIALLFVSIVVHELLHGIGYLLGGASWSGVTFGVKELTPYAHCEVPLNVWSYRLAVALPGLILAVFPAIVALWIGSWGWMIYATVMATSALGDALILWLLRDVSAAAQVQDHPSKVGCEILI